MHYDLIVVDENNAPIRSIAQDAGRQFLYSPSGQSIVNMIVNEEPGTAHYVVVIYGLAPQYVVPAQETDYLQIDITVYAPDMDKPQDAAHMPPWFKNTARWWADGMVDDNSFIEGMQFLIDQGIIRIPATAVTPDPDAGTDQVPSWFKNTAGWWADGTVDDNSFIEGMQFLIERGIIRIPAAAGT